MRGSAVASGGAEVHTPWLGGVGSLPAGVFPTEPANALSVPTWIIHTSSLVEWLVAMGLAFLLCPVGIIGDLVESLLKRDADIKDTGALLPGMGGVLDRIDAVLLALPVMFYLLLGYLWLQIG